MSACLAGCNCRYDGGNQLRPEMVKLIQENRVVPLCPEQLGGLPTPRPPAEQIANKLKTIDGRDVTNEYERGAQEALKLAIQLGAEKAYLKSRSPMCGADEIYDGTFSGNLTTGDGVLVKLLKERGIEIIKVD